MYDPFRPNDYCLHIARNKIESLESSSYHSRVASEQAQRDAVADRDKIVREGDGKKINQLFRTQRGKDNTPAWLKNSMAEKQKEAATMK